MKMTRKIIAAYSSFLVLPFLSACGSLMEPAEGEIPLDEQSHVVRISPVGTSSSRNDFTKIYRGIEKSGKSKILLYIHGGLNDIGSAEARLQSQGHEMLDDGYYPILVGWDSSFMKSYGEYLVSLRRGQRGTAPWSYLGSPFYLAADFVRSIGRAPITWFSHLSNMVPFVGNRVTEDIQWDQADAALANAYLGEDVDPALPPFVTQYPVNYNLMEDRNLTISDRIASGPGFTMRLVSSVVFAPAVDTFGKSSWDVMYRRTQVMFNNDVHLPNEYKTLNENSISFTGGLGVFLEGLQDKINKLPEQNRPSITLMGHSMGAIVVNHILRDFPDLPINEIVYMAAASSVKDYEDSALPYLEYKSSQPIDNGANPNIYHLVLHEKAELRDRTAVFLEGSLLVWIDDFLSNPLTLRDRTAGRIENLALPVFRTPEEFRNQIHVKKFGRLGLGPRRHGDFTDEGCSFWDPDYWDPSKGDFCKLYPH